MFITPFSDVYIKVFRFIGGVPLPFITVQYAGRGAGGWGYWGFNRAFELWDKYF